jgi:hypothetical protein
MIYEVRTYTLRTGAVPEFEERYEKRLAARLKHSKLGAFWHTDFGPLNQVIHVYPYDDLDHRTRVRAALATDRERNALPSGQDLIVAQESEIMIPAPPLPTPQAPAAGRPPGRCKCASRRNCRCRNRGCRAGA